MTVSTEACYAERAWTGVETSFDPGFPAMSTADLRLVHVADDVRTPLTLGVHFAATLAAGTRMVTVTPLPGMPAGPGTIEFARRTPATNEQKFRDDARFSKELHEVQADREAMRTAELRRETDAFGGLKPALTDMLARAVRVPAGELPAALPPQWERAWRYGAYGGVGELIAVPPPSVNVISGAADFRSAFAAIGATLPAAQSHFRTAGYYDPQDRGGALYAVLDSDPGHRGVIPLAGGKFGVLADDSIRVEMFGARAYSYDQLIAAHGDVVASDAAFIAALAEMERRGGGIVEARGQFYVLTEGLILPAGVVLAGAGHGMWNPNFRTEHKTWEGTNLLFKGAGAKSWSTVGVTSMRYAGGWRTDPDSARVFKLTSLTNADARGSTPATPRPLSVAIRNRDPEEPFGLRNMRICPWIGTDGISEYSETTGSDLGDEWDIGVLLADSEQSVIENVQIRGYWRAFGLLELSAGYSSEGRSEGNILRKVSAQGHTGLGVRSGDIWQVKATTSSTLEILWSEESYWPASGAFEGLQNGTDYTYTSLSRNGANLVFNGVSPNPSGTTQIRNPLRGTGFSTGILENCEGWALWHHSGQSAETLGFSSPSKGAEFSGFPLRGLHGVNPSIFGENTTSPCVFFHHAVDLVLIGGKFEIGHVIASPVEGSSAASAPAGATSNLRFVDTYISTSCDMRLFTPRSFHAPQLQINPVGRLSSHFLIEPLAGQDWLARIAGGQNFQVVKSDGTSGLIVFDSGNVDVRGTLTIGGSARTGFINSRSGFGLNLREGITARLQIQAATGHIQPGADNTQHLGSASLRFSTVYVGTGTINTSDVALKATRDGMLIGLNFKVSLLEAAELAAARDLIKEIGIYRWQDAIAAKGAAARLHIGMTVQRAIEIMESHGLDPWRYGFICRDKISRKVTVTETRLVQAVENVDECCAEIEIRAGVPVLVEKTRAVQRPRFEMVAVVNEAGELVTNLGKAILHPVPVMIEVSEEVEIEEPAGERLGFRYDELMLFILAGVADCLAPLDT